MQFPNLSSTRLVPVAVIPKLEAALPLAEALLKADIPHIEITLRTECALAAMRAIREEYPEMTVGAGTVLDPEILPRLLEIGVSFGVAPGLNPAVIEKAAELDFPMMPGIITPSEVERALAWGLKTLKFFPAEAAGGAKMLKALAGPYAHTGVGFVPTGGINPQNAEEYLALSVTTAIGGSWFVDKQRILDGDFTGIQQSAAEALELTRG